MYVPVLGTCFVTVALTVFTGPVMVDKRVAVLRMVTCLAVTLTVAVILAAGTVTLMVVAAAVTVPTISVTVLVMVVRAVTVEVLTCRLMPPAAEVTGERER